MQGDINKYPLLRYSYRYAEAIKCPFFKVDPPEELPEPPNKPKMEDYQKSSLGAVGWLISFFGMFILISADLSNLKGGSFFVVLFLLEIAPLFLFQWLAGKENMAAYNTALNEYKQKRNKWDLQSTSNFQLKLEYEKFLGRVEDHKNNDYHLDQNAKDVVTFNLFLDQVTRPKNGINQKKGVSESFFLELLSKNLPEGFLVSGSMLLEFGPDVGYYPDICLYSKNSDVYVDIEIDEPYVLKEHTPIHCIESNDHNRDSFFQSNGWHVIRFTEYQVLRHPEACINFILAIISKLGQYKLSVPIFSGTYHQKWNAEQSKKMAVARIRERYLGIA